MIKLKRATSRNILYIVGSGGHGLSLASVASQSGFKEICFLNMQDDRKSAHGFPSYFLRSVIANLNNCSLAIAIGDNYVRQNVYNEILNLAAQVNITLRFPNIVHPQVSIAKSVVVGLGNQLFPQSNIGAGGVVEDFVIMNHLSSLDHECTIKSFSSFAPAAITGGNVKIGNRSALLLSSAVSHNVRIGSDSVLAANSFLKEDMGDFEIYGGSPAHFIRGRQIGEGYL